MAGPDHEGGDDHAGRPLTGFEHVLLGTIDAEPRSGYQLKKVFGASPSSVYQPSPGALYPALRRLEARGLLRTEQISTGRRGQRRYHATEAGRAIHLDWLREPIVADRVGNDLGLHLMRFALMENRLPPADVAPFLADLAAALEVFVTGLERFLATGALSGRPLPTLAVGHGIAIHRASLDWARAAHATLAR